MTLIHPVTLTQKSPQHCQQRCDTGKAAVKTDVWKENKLPKKRFQL